MLLEIDSVYLAKCIYNKGCNESTLNDFPAYVQPLGTLIIDEGNASIDNICDMITLKNNGFCFLEHMLSFNRESCQLFKIYF